jgi:hypothetical protein
MRSTPYRAGAGPAAGSSVSGGCSTACYPESAECRAEQRKGNERAGASQKPEHEGSVGCRQGHVLRASCVGTWGGLQSELCGGHSRQHGNAVFTTATAAMAAYSCPQGVDGCPLVWPLAIKQDAVTPVPASTTGPRLSNWGDAPTSKT